MQTLIWKDDPAYPLNAAFMARQLDVRPGLANKYLVANSSKTGIIVKEGTIIPLKSGATWKAFLFTSDTEVTTLDTGVLTLGVDYYVYLCDNGSDSGLLLISANSTAPSGYTTGNSRKIGGFHCGRVRNSLSIADITSNVVVPNSVWDLCHRPRCSPEGMVYIGNGTWIDIYLCSVDEAITFANGPGSPLVTGTAKSAYNAIPLTGIEGLNWYNFNELAMRSGKRLPTLAEWLQAAYGAPQGNNDDNFNAWTATTNNSRAATGYVPNAVSLQNVVDAVGNIWENLDEFAYNQVNASGWDWHNVMPNMNVGQLYMYGNNALTQVIAGGYYSRGAYNGSRTIAISINPWNIHPHVGARMACDSL